jgi:hypothetical protein
MNALRAALVTTALAALFAVVPAGAKSYPRLIGTVGFGRITLKDERGRTIKSLKAGRYSLVVVDRSTTQNFHTLGRGVNVRTQIVFQGSKSWSVSFRKGTTVKYFSDASPRKLKGSFTVR